VSLEELEAWIEENEPETKPLKEPNTMTEETFDPRDGEDYYTDGDLAAPSPLPVGKRYIGLVSVVDTSQAEIGGYRKVEGNLKNSLVAKGDYRDEIPQVTLQIVAVGVAGQPKGFPEETNYMKQSKLDYWVGKVDGGGRNALARLVKDAGGLTDEDMKQMPIRESAKKLEKCYLTFEVKHVAGNSGGTFANPIKVKAATAEEVALVM